MTRTRRKPTATTARKEDRRLVVATNVGPGEDRRIFEVNVLHPHTVAELDAGTVRLFDPATDDRGPEVPFIATFTGKPSVWHPESSGVYVVAFKPDTPETVRKGWHLGMGSCSAPQHTRARIARVWADLSENPALAGHLRVLKVPCMFHADAPEAPGGSSVEIDPATLPAPVDSDKITRTYM